jgi:hypothetical protein
VPNPYPEGPVACRNDSPFQVLRKKTSNRAIGENKQGWGTKRRETVRNLRERRGCEQEEENEYDKN